MSLNTSHPLDKITPSTGILTIVGGVLVPQVALTDASTVAINVATLQSVNLYLLLTSAVGSTRVIGLPTNILPGMVLNLEIKQPSSGGPCAATWNAAWKWGKGGAGSAPTLSTTASASDFLSATVQADGNLHAAMIDDPGTSTSGTSGLTLGAALDLLNLPTLL